MSLSRKLGLVGLGLCLMVSAPAAAQQSNPASRPASKDPASRPVSKAPTSRPAGKTPARKAPPRSNYLPVPRTSTPAPSPRRTTPPQTRTAQSKASKPDLLDGQVVRIAAFLRGFLVKHGRDPKNPWLLAHSLLALGKDLKLKDGQLAAHRIVSGYLRFRKVGNLEIPYFPPGTNRDRIEPHPFMQLKTMLEVGLPMSTKFKVGTRTITLKQMFDASVRMFPDQPKGKELGRLAWLLGAMYGRVPPRQWRWLNAEGKLVIFLRLLWRVFHYLDRNTTFLRVLQQRGVKQIPKRRQYIYGEPCGGFHLIQSTLRWMKHPLLKKRLKALFDAQLSLIFYRYAGETKLYLTLFKKYQKNPGYSFLILLQQLKFLGHFLETVGKLSKWGILKPNKQQRLQIRRALKLMLVTVMLIQRMGFYRGILALKKKAYQYYLDLLGDSAHALHSLRLLHKTKIYHIP